MNLGQAAAAGALVSSTNVSTSYAYLLTFDETTQDQQLSSLNNSAG
jgi:hypothetical protein